ncbi:hypothetical protein CyaNS01_00749 [Cyanobium sp. NS01]|nr:hypothetical protein CyaNS01_00749 [Cyanobium sp. NS01]
MEREFRNETPDGPEAGTRSTPGPGLAGLSGQGPAMLVVST